MRILCLHGRGSNNDIFKMQTAGFRSRLDDFEFEFVQGTIPHAQEGWAIHTSDFADSDFFEYFDLLDPHNVLETEQQLLQLVEEDGPFDGVLGYSQGAVLAAQALIRFAADNPHATAEEYPFRFAIFFNCPTPIRVFEVTEPATEIEPEDEPDAVLFYMLSRANPLLNSTKMFAGQLPNGRRLLTDNKIGMTKCDFKLDGTLIKIPTLHVRCPDDKEQFGEQMYHLCDKATASQLFHKHEHDFPRGYDEMRSIARAIRQLAESVG
ncbi:hypothetical protein K432DRAFT_359288 [Lepidopterella palustris CBS 459.81]|uniref:Serine hydrolase domain-containing protein n=1 Tax=Lepidopterella palustris CBS 459.81 TaxID=1314670 RepID=A0A8E2E448_9PEZI|nr:hypothetical protein K432DRAFT_359288 [Lepidopterella palustris CBS 459.81]